MKYNQPYGVSDPNGPYVNGNPSTGTMGSIPPAASIEYPQREIVNLITHAGLAPPDNADLNQLAKAVQSTLLYSDDDAGTANQYQVTQLPPPTTYFRYQTVITKIANTNTGPSTLNVNALGPKPINHRDGSPLVAGELVQGMLACLIYDGVQFQLVWSNTVAGSGGGQLTQNTTLYVNTATGNDATYDGTAAVLVAGTNHGPFKTIQRAVNEAFKYQPSASFTITIAVAAGTYAETVATPQVAGPTLIIHGDQAAQTAVLSSSVGGSNFTVNGPNTMYVKWLKVTNTAANSAGFSANGSGSTMLCSETYSGLINGWLFLANGNGACSSAGHTFQGSCSYPFAAYRAGSMTIAQAVAFSIPSPISVIAFAYATSGGQIEVPGTSPPTFPGAGNVSGSKYAASLNGVINTQGAGANYFPGTTAGSLASGGQYG